jgi:hypothetical protein
MAVDRKLKSKVSSDDNKGESLIRATWQGSIGGRPTTEKSAWMATSPTVITDNVATISDTPDRDMANNSATVSLKVE